MTDNPFLVGIAPKDLPVPADPWPGWHPRLRNGQWHVEDRDKQICPPPNIWPMTGYGDAMRRSLEMNRAWTERTAKKHGLEISAGLGPQQSPTTLPPGITLG